MRPTAKAPLDPFPYAREPTSRAISTDLPDGTYVYVRDIRGVVYVLRDGPHRHPRILGGGQPATYAGDLTVQNGTVMVVTNLSGTFQFDDRTGLLEIADSLVEMGFRLAPLAVRLFPMDGSRPVILR